MKLRNIIITLGLFFSIFLISCSTFNNDSAAIVNEHDYNITEKYKLEASSTEESYLLTLNASNIENNELKEGYTSIITATLNPAREDIYYHWVVNGESLISSSGIGNSYSWNSIGNLLTITANAKSGSLNIVCYASLDDEATNLIAQNAIVINLISRDSTTSEIIDSILNNTTVIVTTISIAASILCKVAIKIFRFGVNYKSNFASVEQQKDFESEVKEELRAAKSEIQENVLKSTMRVIERETAPLKELRSIQEDVKATKLNIDMQLKNVDSKYEDLRKTSDSVRDLEKRMNTLQYGDSEPSRRSGK